MAWGHPLEAIWNYTPRQAAAWAKLGHARARSETAERLLTAFMAARGKSEAVTKQIRDWDEG